MSIVNFAPARRVAGNVLVSLNGMSGTGKTLSAIKMARGFVGPKGKIAVIDTERGRASIYAKEAGGFDHGELTQPFTPERYIEAIKQAEAGDYQALIIDSASHEWDGLGGTIEMADTSGKQGLIKWAQPKARHKRFVQTLLSSRVPLIIVCLRAKEKMRQENNKIISDGFFSIQEKTFIYEMTVQLRMIGDGKFVIEKCPADLRSAFPEGQPISIGTGERIQQWVSSAEPMDRGAVSLVQQAQEKAQDGTDALGVWWQSITKEQRKALAGQLDNLKSIAAAADQQAAEQLQSGSDENDDDEEDERLRNPFGERKPTSSGAGPVPAGDTGAVAGEASGAATTANPPEAAAQQDDDLTHWLISPQAFPSLAKFGDEWRRQLDEVCETAAHVDLLVKANADRLKEFAKVRSDAAAVNALRGDANFRRGQLARAA